MLILISYVAALIVFGAIDAIWLTTMGPLLYRPTLGDILAPDVRLAPAIVFYLLFPIGIVVFAVLPALRSESALTALGLGLLFGAIAYATYDLTNFATLRNWTLQITIIDMIYGAVTSGVAAFASYHAVRFAANWLGQPTP